MREKVREGSFRPPFFVHNNNKLYKVLLQVSVGGGEGGEMQIALTGVVAAAPATHRSCFRLPRLATPHL